MSVQSPAREKKMKRQFQWHNPQTKQNYELFRNYTEIHTPGTLNIVKRTKFGPKLARERRSDSPINALCELSALTLRLTTLEVPDESSRSRAALEAPARGVKHSGKYAIMTAALCSRQRGKKTGRLVQAVGVYNGSRPPLFTNGIRRHIMTDVLQTTISREAFRKTPYFERRVFKKTIFFNKRNNTALP
ncbi:hypothetical protein IscW_ISCW020681 [Ixodes scapularis]|uniref:Uncharacterized protein n=1 Tax=Ixodes scapularis TaxID=6945 RepID=B7Q2H2_IXOSC|nr:hypothetical protein IscW_ISCW020681 [Ixodes scapularis]|eukprot:XP_002410815.1 hypothetical protein IscW_ISCW020681 [Ixodes scapularis]